MAEKFDAINHRDRTVGPSVGRAVDKRRHENGHHRTKAIRWHLRQRRLHPDQDPRRQRVCRLIWPVAAPTLA